jgi:hypothetical protein
MACPTGQQQYVSLTSHSHPRPVLRTRHPAPPPWQGGMSTMGATQVQLKGSSGGEPTPQQCD